jgi:hypothetical protein
MILLNVLKIGIAIFEALVILDSISPRNAGEAGHTLTQRLIAGFERDPGLSVLVVLIIYGLDVFAMLLPDKLQEHFYGGDWSLSPGQMVSIRLRLPECSVWLCVIYSITGFWGNDIGGRLTFKEENGTTQTLERFLLQGGGSFQLRVQHRDYDLVIENGNATHRHVRIDVYLST